MDSPDIGSGEDLRLNGSEIAVVRGVHNGNIFVLGSSTLILRGIVRGSVYIENEAKVFIHGIVTGNVTNNGGILKHYGLFGLEPGNRAGIFHPS